VAELILRGLRILAGEREIVADSALTVRSGECVAVVGSSGSGKTLTARAALGLVDLEPGVVAAELEIRSDEGVFHPYHPFPRSRQARDRAFEGIRGSIVGYLPQDGRASLDPLQRVGAQVTACARLNRADADPDAWLRKAGFADPAAVSSAWPHELSGGMAQRVALAQALARGSRILLADEPTTALDPTLQAEILASLRALVDAGLGLAFITHDLRLLPGVADRVVCMDGGRVVEELPATAVARGEVTSAPARRLLEATRRIAGTRLGVGR
jgi:ABC-type dipeptide/oligopeptide/nickel transport system ATPase component